MPAESELLKTLYDAFNSRDIERALSGMHQEVVWANGMEGGNVYGRNGVRDYWTRQWQLIDPRVDPIRFEGDAAEITVEVRQVVRDLTGEIKSDQVVHHSFQMEEGLVKVFRIL